VPPIQIDQPWATIIAALGAALLTNIASFWVLQWQRLRDRKVGAKKDKAAAYGQLLARTMTFDRRAGMLNLVMRSRSGLQDRLDVVLGIRQPLDLFQLHEWLEEDFTPITDAWARIWAVGTQDAIDAADRLVHACADVLNAAATIDTNRTRLQAWWRNIAGEVLPPQQKLAYDAAVKNLARERIVFVKLIRKELGSKTVEFALERVEKDVQETGGTVAGK
jgi:hypothetical protein